MSKLDCLRMYGDESELDYLKFPKFSMRLSVYKENTYTSACGKFHSTEIMGSNVVMTASINGRLKAHDGTDATKLGYLYKNYLQLFYNDIDYLIENPFNPSVMINTKDSYKTSDVIDIIIVNQKALVQYDSKLTDLIGRISTIKAKFIIHKKGFKEYAKQQLFCQHLTKEGKIK